MADFKKISDFTKSKTSRFPYQDPTYLSFLLMFDFTDKVNSPFLATGGATEAYLNKLATAGGDTDDYYSEKLENYKNFKKALKTINIEMPWYWQSISGLDLIQKYDPMNNYRGGDEARLEIATLESLNLPISGLMHLYRKACFDENKWQWIIPKNLREFRMYVYVTEIRSIQNVGSISKSNLPGSTGGAVVKNDNKDVSGETARPYFMFGLKGCEFDLTGGTDPFASLTKSTPEAAGNTISITYDIVSNIEARVLNGIINDGYNQDKLSPAPESENTTEGPLEGGGPNDPKRRDRIGQFIKDKKDRLVNDLKKRGENKVKELKTQAEDATIGRLKRTTENLYREFVESIDDALDPAQQFKNIKAAIGENVHKDVLGRDPKTANEALGQAAQDSLGNVYE